MTPHTRLPSEPTALSALVEATPGSVVSKVLFRADGCTATLFAFARGEGLTEHTSPHTAVVLLLEGTVELGVRPTPTAPIEAHHLETGEVFRIPPGAPHELRSDEGFKMLLLLIKEAAPES